MALAVNVINRRGPSNEMRRQLQPKKTNILAIYIAAEDILPALQDEALQFKSGCVVRVENHKMRNASPVIANED